jgi:Kef-type K+ transport system membrane component KefB
MIHPLFRLLVAEPQLIADHVEAYAQLVTEEAGAMAAQIKHRVLMQVVSLAGLLLGAFFALFALMLWAAVPELRAPWVLVAVPAVLLAGGIVCWLMAKTPEEESHGMKAIREQLAADAAMLRSVSAQS